MARIRNLQDVVDWDLCSGCGACAYACTHGAIQMENIVSEGLRPHIDPLQCDGSECLSVCPGASVQAPRIDVAKPISEAAHEFGPALEIFEGYASDPEIRFRASSGGILTALALFCLEKQGMQAVVHTGRDEATPWLNKTVQSCSREELLSRAGSRYAPASPCDGLAQVEQSERPCVFIGKPCDTAAAFTLRKTRPLLDSKLGLVLSFFCAGTPSTQGTIDLAQREGIEANEIGGVRYRGDGWPGSFKILSHDRSKQLSVPYRQAWDALTAYRPLRCNLCPDGVGRLADISCGDAWHKIDDDNPGLSIIIVRTQRGREILQRAVAANYVTLMPAGVQDLLEAQPSLVNRRRELFGRLLALQLLLIPAPQYRGFSLFHSWIRLPFPQICRTVAGTLRRALLRGWWHRHGHARTINAPASTPTRT